MRRGFWLALVVLFGLAVSAGWSLPEDLLLRWDVRFWG
jgi:hypothetical protein